MCVVGSHPWGDGGFPLGEGLEIVVLVIIPFEVISYQLGHKSAKLLQMREFDKCLL